VLPSKSWKKAEAPRCFTTRCKSTPACLWLTAAALRKIMMGVSRTSIQFAWVLSLTTLLVAPSSAQAPASLAGTWKLATPADGREGRGSGVPGFPLATTLVIKVSPTEVVVDSDTGSARSIQTFVYKLDGSSTNVPGPLGWETSAKAAIDGGRLVVTIRRSIEGPNGPVGVNVTDAYSVDGNVLTIDRTQGRTSQKLVYNKAG
jgi:hypothetical protein